MEEPVATKARAASISTQRAEKIAAATCGTGTTARVKATLPASSIGSSGDCTAYYPAYYWWNRSCNSSAPSAEQIDNSGDCAEYAYYWWNGSCNSSSPSAEQIDNSSDCTAYDFSWWSHGSYSGDAASCISTGAQGSASDYTGTGPGQGQTACEDHGYWWHTRNSGDRCEATNPHP
jgi:hypothetical protein